MGLKGFIFLYIHPSNSTKASNEIYVTAKELMAQVYARNKDMNGNSGWTPRNRSSEKSSPGTPPDPLPPGVKLFFPTVIPLPLLHTITRCPSFHEIVFALGLDLKPKDAVFVAEAKSNATLGEDTLEQPEEVPLKHRKILLSDVEVKREREILFGRKWNSLDIGTFGIVLSMHLLCLFAPFNFNWAAFWVAVALYVITGLFGITLSFHRNLSHRSFKLPKWLE
ncbi:hypothetical protein TSUD_258810 [Trifolium subterraneum]|uniref:Uncharacterized protein n=1 Tax=Trifolium subterraneum TaxID=3900 RepID=A0A2Z6MUE6_TRISU|nr:hypothetical protein TSUD_258810 [Trifolium subterraneum]